MPYLTRPYIPFTLFVPNPAKCFEISSDRLRVRVLGNVDLDMALPPSTVTRSPGLAQAVLHTLLNCGSLDVFDAGGVKHTLHRVIDVQSLRSALAGTHPAIVAEVAEQARLYKLCNLKDADLADWVVYYPHIPKAVDMLLRARDPNRYNDYAYTNLVTKGSGVMQGQVIARYGDFQITAPFDGRLEMLGEARPGLHEWPDLQNNYVSDGTEDERKIANLNFYSLVFARGIPEREAYAFALRPIRNPVAMTEGKFGSFRVSAAFDYGQVYLGMKRPEDLDRIWKKRYSFYSIIDMAVFDLKSPGSGIPLPDTLRNDQVYRNHLMRYWYLINHAKAMVRCPGE